MRFDNLEDLLLVDPRAAKTRELASERVDGEFLLARAMKFERDLDDALATDVPAGLAERLSAIALSQTVSTIDSQLTKPSATTSANASTSASTNATTINRSGLRHKWYRGAIAAGLMFAVGWFYHQQTLTLSFAQQCADHLMHEPYALTRTSVVPNELVVQKFAEVGVKVQNLPSLNYANLCDVAGWPGVHAVAQRNGAPTTILVFPEAKDFQLGESRIGANIVRISRLGHGALVLLAENAASFDSLEMEMQKALMDAQLASVAGR